MSEPPVTHHAHQHINFANDLFIFTQVKKARKEKKDKGEKAEEAPEISYEERLKAVSPISTPMANEKLTKKLHKLVRKASGAKSIRRGVKEVIKALRKVMF
jgi:H/ACA ribonucleoprotein complex subunit 2